MRTILDYINTFVRNSTPAQGGVLESEFWASEILSFSDGEVGKASPINNWISCEWEGRDGN